MRYSLFPDERGGGPLTVSRKYIRSKDKVRIFAYLIRAFVSWFVFFRLVEFLPNGSVVQIFLFDDDAVLDR